MLLNAGCGTHYAVGWVNCDLISDDKTTPDVVVNAGEPYPFDDSTADAVFLGHVLEHMPWEEVFPFMEDILRVAKPGAPVLIVGPDVYRTITCWANGSQPWHMVKSTMEHQGENFQPDREDQEWDGAPHYWNCHEERIGRVLDHFGLRWKSYTNRIPCAPSVKGWPDAEHSIIWPVVGYHEWQFAVMAYAEKPGKKKIVVERPHASLGMGYMD